MLIHSHLLDRPAMRYSILAVAACVEQIDAGAVSRFVPSRPVSENNYVSCVVHVIIKKLGLQLGRLP